MTTPIAATPVQTLRICDIHSSPLNPRSPDVARSAGLPVSAAFGEETLRELGESLRSPTGQLEAVLVRPHPSIPGAYELANGERRWRAAALVGMETLAARVRDMSDAELVEIALATGGGANVETLTPFEEAKGYASLMTLRGWTMAQLAEHLGRPLMHVNRMLALLALPDNAKAALQEGRLPFWTAWFIARIPGDGPRQKAADAILNSELHGGVMPGRAAATYIETEICRTLKSAPFDTKADFDGIGPCTTCRYRAGNNPEEYGDVGEPHKCMNPACYEEKVAAHRARVLAKVAVDGRVALPPAENAKVFPPEERGLHFTADYVPLNERPTPDLLKPEVNSAPTWKELVSGGEAKVQVYVGLHQDGHAVELVKRDEAIAAADLNERRIFANREAQRGTTQKLSREADAAASRAEQERAEKEARKKAEKAQRKKDKTSRALLAELFDKLRGEDDRQSPIWRSYAVQSLLFEALRDTLTAEEIAYVVEACDAEAGEEDRTRDGLNDLSSRLPLDPLAALNVVLCLAPRIRAQGAEGELATLWAKEIIAGSGDLAGVKGPMGEEYPPAAVVARLSERQGLNVFAAPSPNFPSAIEIYRDGALQGTCFGPKEFIVDFLEWLVGQPLGAVPDPYNAGRHMVEYVPAPLATPPPAEPAEDEDPVCGVADRVRRTKKKRAEERADVDAMVAAKAELEAAWRLVMPDMPAERRVAVMAKYIKRVRKAEAPEDTLTPAEIRKIAGFLTTASIAKKKPVATPEPQQEAA